MDLSGCQGRTDRKMGYCVAKELFEYGCIERPRRQREQQASSRKCHVGLWCPANNLRFSCIRINLARYAKRVGDLWLSFHCFMSKLLINDPMTRIFHSLFDSSSRPTEQWDPHRIYARGAMEATGGIPRSTASPPISPLVLVGQSREILCKLA